jgi:hypothetical protein
MTNSWYTGNADSDAGENRSWLVGHFKDPDDMRYNEDVEVKVSRHVAGDERPEWSTGEVRRTFFMLMSGRWRLDLEVEGTDQPETVLLEKPATTWSGDRGCPAPTGPRRIRS